MAKNFLPRIEISEVSIGEEATIKIKSKKPIGFLLEAGLFYLIFNYKFLIYFTASTIL